MITAEKIREWIIYAIWNNPKLGVNYVDWHTETGECGLTIYPCGEEFEIIIKKKDFYEVDNG